MPFRDMLKLYELIKSKIDINDIDNIDYTVHKVVNEYVKSNDDDYNKDIVINDFKVDVELGRFHQKNYNYMAYGLIYEHIIDCFIKK